MFAHGASRECAATNGGEPQRGKSGQFWAECGPDRSHRASIGVQRANLDRKFFGK